MAISTFAYAEVYGYEKGISETEKLELIENRYYHALLGHLYMNIDLDAAVSYYKNAIGLTKSPSERHTFMKALEAVAPNAVST